MFGLTEEESAALVAATADLETAQRIIDHLKEKSSRARLDAILARKRAYRPPASRIHFKKDAPRQDYPKPASKIPSPRYTCEQLLNPPPMPPRDAIIDTFSLVKSFAGVAITHSLGRGQTRRALRDAGIDICEEAVRDWDHGISVQELSRRHGIGRDTIARWIRKTGRTIKPRNGNRRYDEELIAETYRETNSVNKAALAAGVAWDTARSVLSRNGIRVEGRSRRASVSGPELDGTCQPSPHS